MLVIAAIVGLLYLTLYILARKERPDGAYGAGIFFVKTASFLWGKTGKRHERGNKGVRRDLRALNPGNDSDKTLDRYYIKKIALFLEIVFAGTAVAVLVWGKNHAGTEILDGGNISRGNFSEGCKVYSLTLNGKDAYELTLNPYILSEQEADELYAEFQRRIQEFLPGENESLERVSRDLVLKTEIEGFPFSAEWESDQPETVNTLGEVATVKEPQKVVLTVVTRYEDMEWTGEFEITVIAPKMTEEEKRVREIQGLLIHAEENSRTEQKFGLPQEYMGEKLNWKQKLKDNSIWIWGGSVCLAVVLFFMSDKDLHSDLERRRELAKRDYPDIVQKFVLYMGAGMTARNTFKKLALDYEERVRNGSEIKPAYEEILYSYRELLSGVPEAEMYEHFGRRIGIREYMRLSTLLQQNARKGNADVLDRLREEAEKSMAEKLQNSRKMGEEAGTKLLFPMVMMLLVAMVMIMIPVFISSMI